MSKFSNSNYAFFFGSAVALLYGLWARVTFQSPWEDWWDLALGTITLGFCFAFTETINHWEDGKSISFEIKVNPGATPPRAPLNQIGGRYLDVFEGGFTIEPRETDRVILHLSSRHRLSTTFNFYGGLWTDWVMRDLQNYILRVIKNRCEAENN